MNMGTMNLTEHGHIHRGGQKIAQKLPIGGHGLRIVTAMRGEIKAFVGAFTDAAETAQKGHMQRFFFPRDQRRRSERRLAALFRPVHFVPSSELI